MSESAPVTSGKTQQLITTLNISDIERFFQFLDSPTEVFCYCFMDEYSKTVIKGHGIKYGILPEIIEAVEAYAADNTRGDATHGFTLHTTLNRMKLTGRKRKDVDSVRVLCVDFDNPIGATEAKQLKEKHHPDLIVNSSPFKYHFYWKIDPAIDIQTWSHFQLGLSYYFMADLNLAQPNHTIRVPGVSRICKDGTSFMPRIVYQQTYTEDPAPMTYDEVLELFPWILDDAAKAQEKQQDDRRIIGKASKHLVAGKKINYEVLRDTTNNRNETLYSLLYSIASNTLEDTTESALCQIAAEYNHALINHPKGPLDQDEIDKTVRSALEHGLEKREEKRAKNRDQIDKLLQAGTNGINGNGTNGYGHHMEQVKFEYDYSFGDMAANRFSDLAATEMVLQKFKHHLVRVGKVVYAFDEKFKVWRSQKGLPDIVQDFVTQCLNDMARDPELLTQRCTNDAGEISPAKVKRERERLSSIRLISQVITYVLNSADIRRVTFADFDTNPSLFYAKNGVVDLMTADIRPARATDMLLRQANVTFNRDVDCPYFKNFISEIYAHNQAPSEVIRFIQELFGYSLTGSIQEQTIFIHTGDGANGKSRVLGALSALMGDYSTRVQPGTLTKNKTSLEKEVSRLGAKIEGKRVMIIDDLDTRTQWDDSLVKTLTDSTMTARLLYEEERDIPNRAKIHIGCNQTPNIEHGGTAMDRRICIIEYPRQFTPSPAKFEEIVGAVNRELSGILNWAIEGFQRVQTYPDKKTKWPEEVSVRVEEYQEANATPELDVEALFEKSDIERHSLDEIIEHIKRWSKDSPVQIEWGKEKLGILLRKKGFKKERIRTTSGRISFYYLTFKDSEILEKL